MDRRLKAVASVAVVAAVFLVVVLRRGKAQGTATISTDGPITMVSVLENDQPVNNGYPSLIRDRQGDLWCAWVSARLKDPDVKGPYQEGDMVVLRVRREGKWGPALLLNTDFGVSMAPVLVEDQSGDVIAAWGSRRQGSYGIWWRRVRRDLTLGPEGQVPPAGQLEAMPALTASADGVVYLAFQSYRQGSSDIVFYRMHAGGWQRLPDAAATPDPEFRPRLAAAPDGAVWCAWDTYSKGKYRVMVRRFDPRENTWGAAEEVPGAGRLDAFSPDIAVDAQGRVWVTYVRNEVEEPAWGLRGPKPGPSPRPTVRLVVRDASQWGYPQPLAGQEPGLVATGDIPRVTVGPDGAVWCVWQKLLNHVDWKIGAACYQGDRWAGPQVFGLDEPVALDGPPRRADQRAAVVAGGPGRLIIAYERGRGVFRNRDIYVREVRADGLQQGSPVRLALFSPAELQPVERPLRRPPERPAIHTIQGERLQLYFGDLHNHLLIDDGHEGWVDQLFAIHRDRYGMDFAASTSHGDSNKFLISELALNELLAENMLSSGRFVSICGFEWTQGDFVVPRAGHRHVIYETPGGPLYRPTEGTSDSIREFVDLMSKTNGLIFAHHVSRAYSGGTDWSYVNVKIEPAVEICSSWGRFEYYQNPGHIRVRELKNCSVQDAWRMGWRLGVIGGSDGHNLFTDRIQGLTAVYATELTRPAIFQALRKRRCYATTGEPIIVDFRVNGHLMGSEIAASDGPVIEARVEGTRKLLAVEVVKRMGDDFRVVHRAVLNGRQAKVWWKDPDFRQSTMYYLRVSQEVEPALAARYAKLAENPFPTEMAWSSPVWVEKK